MTPQRVLALLDLLEGLAVWVDGGWGVDALVGRQTREHGISIWGSCGRISSAAVEKLATVGYAAPDAQRV